MGDRYNVFISWSGKRSKWAARSLYDWLPLALQSVRPWMSEEDIQKGSRGLDEIGRALEGVKIGVICLTPENLTAPWILYEAGALSKTLDAKTRVCTYLIGGLRPQDVEPPLGMFQAPVAEKDDTRRLVDAINQALDGEPVPKGNLDALFEGMWPRLQKQLEATPNADAPVNTQRPLEEMVAEILDLTRVAANRPKRPTWLDEFEPQFRDALPFITNLLTVARNQWAHFPGSQGLAQTRTPRKVFHFTLKSGETKDVEGSMYARIGGNSVFVYDGAGAPTAKLDEVESITAEELDGNPHTAVSELPTGETKK